MTYASQSLQNDLDQLVIEYPQFKYADKDDEALIHNLLESSGMKLAENVELCYSRRPDLWASYEESRQKPYIFCEAPTTDSDNTCKYFYAVISESTHYFNGKEIQSYYTSDLRIDRKASREVIRDYRHFYGKLARRFPSDVLCFTAVMDENIRALKSLRSQKNPFYYNPMVPYLAQTVVILPTIGLNSKKRMSDYEIGPIEDENALNEFLKQKMRESEFSYDIIEARKKIATDDQFIIVRDGKIEGFFAMYRPKKRSILVKAETRWMKLLIFLVKLLSGEDLSKKVPWVYMACFVASPQLKQEKQLLACIIQHARKKKKLNLGDLFLCVAPKTGEPFLDITSQNFLLKCPQILKHSTIYRVESEQRDALISGEVYLNPVEL